MSKKTYSGRFNLKYGVLTGRYRAAARAAGFTSDFDRKGRRSIDIGEVGFKRSQRLIGGMAKLRSTLAGHLRSVRRGGAVPKDLMSMARRAHNKDYGYSWLGKGGSKRSNRLVSGLVKQRTAKQRAQSRINGAKGARKLRGRRR